MEKEHFDLMAYAVAMADYDRALTIAKELKAHYVATKDNALASIFEKIGDAVIYRKNKEYDKEQELWREISELAGNIDTTLSVFAKACYYDAIADSTEDDAVKKREYKKKVKEEFEKIGDKILILLASAWIEELPEKRANIYEEIARKFNNANLGDFAHQAMGRHYATLAKVAESPKERAELYKKAADEFKAGKIDELYHRAMGRHYAVLAVVAELPKERAALYKKAADEFKAGKENESYHLAMGWHYSALAVVAESPKERAEWYKKAAAEFKKGKKDESYHVAMGLRYSALANVAGSPEERAEWYKKAADEFKAGKDDELYHLAMGSHYSALAVVAESPKERAEWLKKGADEFKAGKDDESYHVAMGLHYSILAEDTESLEARAALHKKAADEFKEGKYEDEYHEEMAWHYYLSSLLSEDKIKEDLKSKAVDETDWLFIANIALSLSKISKEPEKIIYLIKDAISSYEHYLDEKGKKLPVFTLFIDGNLRDEKILKSVTEKTEGYFITRISPFLENKPVEVEELDTMIEDSEFVLMLVDNNVDEILSFELGLAYPGGKPVVLFVHGDLSNVNPIVSQAATITQKLEYAITVLKLFSVIKSGEILEVGKEERAKMTDFLKSIARFKIPQPKIEFEPSFITEKMPLKPKYEHLRGDTV
jgi:protein required for attachment to host cells